jgi:putative transposase
MARPLRIEFEGAFYHVLSRGNERKPVFYRPEDYHLFLESLQEACDRFGVIVHSYCLLPNHFHLLIQTQEANLSVFMKWFLGVYTIRFNKRHHRVGHLFQGRYKAYLVEKDPYLLELSRYIHLNPCRAGLVQAPHHHPWSSMLFFIRAHKKTPSFLETRLILNEFSSRRDYGAFVWDGLKNQHPKNLLEKAVGGVFIASEPFIRRLQKRLSARNLRGITRTKEWSRIPLVDLENRLKGYPETIQIWALWYWGRQTQKEIGQRFSKTDSAISHALSRFRNRLTKDQGLRKQVVDLERDLSSFKN